MHEVITLENSISAGWAIQQLRKVFHEVFSHHYASLMIKASQTGDQGVLTGFSDLIPRFFDNNINKFSYEQIVEKLKVIYRGPGFDDEAAFLWCWKNLKNTNLTARASFEAEKRIFPKKYKDEIVDYIALLETQNRVLKEVNFVAIGDKENLYGFMIYHIFKKNNQTIVHVRQAGMLKQAAGYAGILASYLIDKYPFAIYEANQRRANKVIKKQKMVDSRLLKTCPAWLGYNNTYYVGLRSTKILIHCLLWYDQAAKRNEENTREQRRRIRWSPDYSHSQSNDAECAPMRFFSRIRLIQTTNHDDNFLPVAGMRIG